MNDWHDFPLSSESRPGDAEQEDRTRRRLWMTPLIALGVIVALVGIDVAVINGAQNPPPRPQVNVVKLASSAPAASTVYLTISPDLKPAPDGKLHDAFSVTDFTVHPGQAVKLVINNTDDAPHSITSPSAGVNIVVKPGMHTYTLLVQKQGHFLWYCAYPCDPYSMSHIGYMRGYITSASA